MENCKIAVHNDSFICLRYIFGILDISVYLVFTHTLLTEPNVQGKELGRGSTGTVYRSDIYGILYCYRISGSFEWVYGILLIKYIFFYCENAHYWDVRSTIITLQVFAVENLESRVQAAAKVIPAKKNADIVECGMCWVQSRICDTDARKTKWVR